LFAKSALRLAGAIRCVELTVALSESNNCTIHGGAENLSIRATGGARDAALSVRKVHPL
jgi:hypothetical protein